jgi:hypothetical protein
MRRNGREQSLGHLEALKEMGSMGFLDHGMRFARARLVSKILQNFLKIFVTSNP